MKSDLFALRKLLEGDTSYKVPVRVRSNGWVEYGMGDASRDGLGAVFHINGNLLFRYGQWASAISEAFSNYRDLRNLVEAMEAHVRNRKLRDCEVFLLTDNLVAENSFYKGTSSSETLFGLVPRLRKLELEGDIILHMIHVSGKRMIASRVDVLSKRDTTKGVMKENCVLSYFPFHLGSEQRITELLPWINSWWSEEEPLVHLSSDGWFDNVFIEGGILVDTVSGSSSSSS